MRIKVLVGLLTIAPLSIWAQFSVATLQFGSSLPQSSLINPAIVTDYKVEVGLPGLSSTFVDVNTSLSFKDLVRKDGNVNYIDLQGIPEKLKRDLRISADVDVQLFHLGLKASEGYLSVDVRERVESYVSIPDELIKWGIWGPADSRVSRTILLDDIRVRATSYLEYSAAYARMVVPGLKVGMRAKFISGQLGASGEQSGYLHISADSLSVKVDDLKYGLLGIDDLDFFDDFDPGVLLGRSAGFGIDFGITYDVNEKLTLLGSVTDFGFINWKKNISYSTEDAYYRFTGFELSEVIEEEDEAFQAELDEFEEQFQLEENNAETFRTGLNPKFTASMQYRVTDFYTVGSTFHTSWNNGRPTSLLAIHQTLSAGQALKFLTGITYRNGKISNLTGGLMFKPGPVQFYIISDRINAFYFPARTSSLNLRVGVNVVAGKRAMLTN